MKRAFIAIIFISLLAFIYAERMVISIPFTTMESLQEYIADGHDIASVKPHERIYLVVNEQQRLEFVTKYQDVHIQFTEADMRANLLPTCERIVGYRSNAQINETMFHYQSLYPQFVKVFELGPSQGKLYFDAGNNNYANFNHTIYGVKMSNNVSVLQDKPNYYFYGNLHAREPITAEMCLEIMINLLQTYNPNDANHPLNASQIWIVPNINPDGRRIVFTQTDVWHRKTIFDNNGNGQLDLGPSGNSPDGIDGNRNFSYR